MILRHVYETDVAVVKALLRAQPYISFSCDETTDARSRRIGNLCAVIPGIGQLYLENTDFQSDR